MKISRMKDIGHWNVCDLLNTPDHRIFIEGRNSGECSGIEWLLNVENRNRSYWSKIKIQRALHPTKEILCLGCSSAEACSPAWAATLSSPGDAGQYPFADPSLDSWDMRGKDQYRADEDARARNLR
jgi:hypothetical protein